MPVGLQKQLLADDYVIAETHNITREVGQARKHGVVMKPTLPSDFQTGKVHEGPDGGGGYSFGESAFCWFFSPHWDEQKNMFRLWYMPSKRKGIGLAYAESKDGIKWSKPMVSKDGKSNIVMEPANGAGLDGVTVTIDPSVPYGSPEKYKVAYFPHPGKCQTHLGYSADGINWKSYNNGNPVTGRAADFSNKIAWDPNRKKYLLLCRQDFGAGGGVGELRGVRIMEHSMDNDLINHPTAWKTLTKFVLNDPDKTTVPGSRNVPQRQIHTFPIWYYEGVWFGLTDVLVATDVPVPHGKQDYQTKHEKGVWEFYMAPSRDAINYDFKVAAYPRKPLIPRGPAGSFDKDCARPPANIITHNDEHWIYYFATNERWGARFWDARLALAKLRLDGFFYLEAKDEPGTITTKPFKLEGDKLEVNVNAKEGSLLIEVLDEEGRPISRLSSKSKRVDKLRLTPKLKLKKHKGKTVKLKFTLQNAKLYAFQFKQ
ncbi:MAG: hypothetical protein ISS70_25805 [Phycisphaerae bacterium]|nr:hypothetical protein [Phycisphaerae bacterium]